MSEVEKWAQYFPCSVHCTVRVCVSDVWTKNEWVIYFISFLCLIFWLLFAMQPTSFNRNNWWKEMLKTICKRMMPQERELSMICRMTSAYFLWICGIAPFQHFDDENDRNIASIAVNCQNATFFKQTKICENKNNNNRVFPPFSRNDGNCFKSILKEGDSGTMKILLYVHNSQMFSSLKTCNKTSFMITIILCTSKTWFNDIFSGLIEHFFPHCYGLAFSMYIMQLKYIKVVC